MFSLYYYTIFVIFIFFSSFLIDNVEGQRQGYQSFQYFEEKANADARFGSTKTGLIIIGIFAGVAFILAIIALTAFRRASNKFYNSNGTYLFAITEDQKIAFDQKFNNPPVTTIINNQNFVDLIETLLRS